MISIFIIEKMFWFSIIQIISTKTTYSSDSRLSNVPPSFMNIKLPYAHIVHSLCVFKILNNKLHVTRLGPTGTIWVQSLTIVDNIVDE